MSSGRDEDDTRPVVWAVLIGAIVLAVGLAVGVGIAKSTPSTAVNATDASSLPNVPGLQLRDEESVALVQGDAVLFYFATGQADLPPSADNALNAIIFVVRSAGNRAIVSGFHDSTGSAQLNEALAKQRAQAVHDALVRLGLPEAQIELRKPAKTMGGNGLDGRRVIITIE